MARDADSDSHSSGNGSSGSSSSGSGQHLHNNVNVHSPPPPKESFFFKYLKEILLAVTVAAVSALTTATLQRLVTEHRATESSMKHEQTLLRQVDAVIESQRSGGGDPKVVEDLRSIRQTAEALMVDVRRVQESSKFSRDADYWLPQKYAGMIADKKVSFALRSVSGHLSAEVALNGKGRWMQIGDNAPLPDRDGEPCWLVYFGKAEGAERYGFYEACGKPEQQRGK